MTKTSVRETELVGVEDATSDWRLPDAASIADAALIRALELCGQKTGTDSQQALTNLRRGDRTACDYFHYGLAKEVAQSLGAADQSIKAVYVVDYDATSEDLCFCDSMANPLIHLIVWAQPRTAALAAIVTAIDRAVVRRYGDLVSLPELTNYLDVQIVNDTDVKERLGYGALLSSVHHPPVKIWER